MLLLRRLRLLPLELLLLLLHVRSTANRPVPAAHARQLHARLVHWVCACLPVPCRVWRWSRGRCCSRRLRKVTGAVSCAAASAFRTRRWHGHARLLRQDSRASVTATAIEAIPAVSGMGGRWHKRLRHVALRHVAIPVWHVALLRVAAVARRLWRLAISHWWRIRAVALRRGNRIGMGRAIPSPVASRHARRTITARCVRVAVSTTVAPTSAKAASAPATPTALAAIKRVLEPPLLGRCPRDLPARREGGGG